MTQAKEITVTEEMALNVLNNYTSELMQLPGVVAVGLGECAGAPCIRVLSENQDSELTQQLPKEINGIPITLEVSGQIKARQKLTPHNQ